MKGDMRPNRSKEVEDEVDLVSPEPDMICFWFDSVLTGENVSKIRLGKLSPYTIQYLRNLKKYFGIVFKVVPEHEDGTIMASCFGTGFTNFSRSVR